MSTNFPVNLEGFQRVSSSSAATAVDCNFGVNVFCPLTENTTIGRPTHPHDGMVLTFVFLNTSSNRAVSWNGCFNFVGASAPVITVGVKYSLVAFKYLAAADAWFEQARFLNMG